MLPATHWRNVSGSVPISARPGVYLNAYCWRNWIAHPVRALSRRSALPGVVTLFGINMTMVFPLLLEGVGIMDRNEMWSQEQ